MGMGMGLQQQHLKEKGRGSTAMWENCALEQAQEVAALAFPQLDAKTFGAGPVHCDCLLYKMKIPLTTNVCPSTGEDTATSSPMH